MAGLLSVSWHLNQRDLQVSRLGINDALDGCGKWRSSFIRAYDYWKLNFDETFTETPYDCISASPSIRPMGDEDIFESRTMFHHLAHMASHVDILDCQIFAGADRLLGRTISPRAYAFVREKMMKWAKKALARDATFHALKFLSQILTPDNAPVSSNITGRPSKASSTLQILRIQHATISCLTDGG